MDYTSPYFTSHPTSGGDSAAMTAQTWFYIGLTVVFILVLVVMGVMYFRNETSGFVINPGMSSPVVTTKPVAMMR